MRNRLAIVLLCLLGFMLYWPAGAMHFAASIIHVSSAEHTDINAADSGETHLKMMKKCCADDPKGDPVFHTSCAMHCVPSILPQAPFIATKASASILPAVAFDMQGIGNLLFRPPISV
ncbi:hypothetical protein [Notoacmeibacter ruber]|uniref:Uncharacterized protein n=1 Tax=Notoacmeibacter ruber TaxID=2670375 RepID=A0A3L7J9R4_9HYPH|nr:hypothetical protein [Notoacmeibacter ruber]RLQ87356.1 hypothetical protein D8780_03165 [Notoacmeibacter ruber]